MTDLGRRPLPFGIRMAAKAAEERRKAEVRQEWLAMLPLMNKDTYKPFEEFYRERVRFSGRPTIRRPKEEILAEVAEIRKKAATKRRTG